MNITTTELNKYKRKYKKDGIVVIPNFFSDYQCKKIKEEAYKTKPEDITKAGYPHSPEETAKNKRSLIFFPALANKYLDKIRKDIAPVAQAFLGDNIKQVNNQVYFREAGDHDEFAWHQDIVFREPRDRFPGVEEGYLQTIIAVDDLTLTNGSIEFINGSHSHGEQELTSNSGLTKMLRTFERHGLEGEKYVAPKGSLLLWTVLTVHGSEANMSDSDRMTYMNGFCRAKNCLDYPWYMKDGVLQDLDPKLIP